MDIDSLPQVTQLDIKIMKKEAKKKFASHVTDEKRRKKERKRILKVIRCKCLKRR